MANKSNENMELTNDDVGAALVVQPTKLGYFCHQCQIEFHLLNSNYICPTCLGGFVEEVPRIDSDFGLEKQQMSDEMTSQLMPILDQNFPIRIRADSHLGPLIPATADIDDADQNTSIRAEGDSADSEDSAHSLSCDSAFLDDDGPRGSVSRATTSVTSATTVTNDSEIVGPSTSSGCVGRVMDTNGPTVSGGKTFRSTSSNTTVSTFSSGHTYNRLARREYGLSVVRSMARMDLRVALLHIADYLQQSIWLTDLFREMRINPGLPTLPKPKTIVVHRIEVSEDDVEAKTQCSVCLDEFQSKQEVSELSCGHTFHEDCILQWLTLQCTCPVCRKMLLQDESEDEEEANAQNPEDPPH